MNNYPPSRDFYGFVDTQGERWATHFLDGFNRPGSGYLLLKRGRLYLGNNDHAYMEKTPLAQPVLRLCRNVVHPAMLLVAQ